MPSFSVLLLTSLSAFLLPAASSLTCTTQHFNRHYTNCTDLPHLASYFHWAYNASNSSLSVAFVATPPADGGWVAWATNVNGLGMVGSQALIAFKGSDGVTAVKTYNISSYLWIRESKLDIDVWDLAAERSRDGSTAILAKLKVTAGMKITRFNIVWQVDSAVVGGVPVQHSFRYENEDAYRTLDLSGRHVTAAATIRSVAVDGFILLSFISFSLLAIFYKL